MRLPWPAPALATWLVAWSLWWALQPSAAALGWPAMAPWVLATASGAVLALTPRVASGWRRTIANTLSSSPQWRATAEPAKFGVTLSDVDTTQLMLAGASPRGMSLLLRAARVAAWLEGRSYVTPEDVQAVFVETIAHRLCYQPVFELHRHEISPRLMAAIVSAVAAP